MGASENLRANLTTLKNKINLVRYSLKSYLETCYDNRTNKKFNVSDTAKLTELVDLTHYIHSNINDAGLTKPVKPDITYSNTIYGKNKRINNELQHLNNVLRYELKRRGVNPENINKMSLLIQLFIQSNLAILIDEITFTWVNDSIHPMDLPNISVKQTNSQGQLVNNPTDWISNTLEHNSQQETNNDGVISLGNFNEGVAKLEYSDTSMRNWVWDHLHNNPCIFIPDTLGLGELTVYNPLFKSDDEGSWQTNYTLQELTSNNFYGLKLIDNSEHEPYSKDFTTVQHYHNEDFVVEEVDYGGTIVLHDTSTNYLIKPGDYAFKYEFMYRPTNDYLIKYTLSESFTVGYDGCVLDLEEMTVNGRRVLKVQFHYGNYRFQGVTVEIVKVASNGEETIITSGRTNGNGEYQTPPTLNITEGVYKTYAYNNIGTDRFNSDTLFIGRLNLTCSHDTIGFNNNSGQTSTLLTARAYDEEGNNYSNQRVEFYKNGELIGVGNTDGDGLCNLNYNSQGVGDVAFYVRIGSKYSNFVLVEDLIYYYPNEISFHSNVTSGDHMNIMDQIGFELPDNCMINWKFRTDANGMRFNLSRFKGISPNPPCSLFSQRGSTNNRCEIGYRNKIPNTVVIGYINGDGQYHDYIFIKLGVEVNYYIDDVWKSRENHAWFNEHEKATFIWSYWRPGVMYVKDIKVKKTE